MKKFLSLALALIMTFSLVTISAGAKEFTDKSSINYKNAVDVVSTIGIVDGYTDGSFGPTGTLTRGAAAKVICNLVLGPTTASALGADAKPFKDVATDNTFAGYIAYCAKQGIINGYNDGTFKPAGTVTGYQFLKMLLGALGYNGAESVEGFVGSNWTINVAKLALGIGLTKGNGSFNGAAAMTREEACLYAFNTLKATMVQYDTTGTTITVGDTTISQGASKASDMANNSSTDGNIKRDSLMQFAERYFTDLKCNSAVTDDLGRSSDKWTYKGASIGTYSNTNAVVSYTAETKESAVKTDMNSYSYSKTAVPVWYNGFTSAASNKVMSNKAIADLTANGTLVEVYVNDDTNEVDKVVVVQAFLGKVTSVSTKNETITVQLDTKDATKTITDETGYGTYVKDDYVMVTPLYKAAPTSTRDELAPAKSIQTVDADEDILAITAAQKITGKITGMKTNSYLVMDGTTYNYAVVGERTKDFTVSISNTSDADIYVDAYGYVAGAEASAASGNYLYVAKAWSGNDDYGTPSIRAQVVLSNGTINTVTVSKIITNGSAATADLTNTVKGMYRYSTNGGKYELTTADSYMMGGTTAPTGVTAQTGVVISTGISSTDNRIGGAYFSSTQNVVAISGEPGSDLSAKTYTGKQATTSGTIYYTTTKANGNTIATMFVVGDVVTSSTDLIYIHDAVSNGSSDANGTSYNTYEAYINGVSTNIMVKGNAPTADTFYTYGVDANGVYTLNVKTANVVKNAPLDGVYNSDYITVNSNADLASGNYSASGAVVVDLNTDDDNDATSMSDLQSLKDDNHVINISAAYNTESKTVSVIYVVTVDGK